MPRIPTLFLFTILPGYEWSAELQKGSLNYTLNQTPWSRASFLAEYNDPKSFCKVQFRTRISSQFVFHKSLCCVSKFEQGSQIHRFGSSYHFRWLHFLRPNTTMCLKRRFWPNQIVWTKVLSVCFQFRSRISNHAVFVDEHDEVKRHFWPNTMTQSLFVNVLEFHWLKIRVDFESDSAIEDEHVRVCNIVFGQTKMTQSLFVKILQSNQSTLNSWGFQMILFFSPNRMKCLKSRFWPNTIVWPKVISFRLQLYFKRGSQIIWLEILEDFESMNFWVPLSVFNDRCSVLRDDKSEPILRPGYPLGGRFSRSVNVGTQVSGARGSFCSVGMQTDKINVFQALSSTRRGENTDRQVLNSIAALTGTRMALIPSSKINGLDLRYRLVKTKHSIIRKKEIEILAVFFFCFFHNPIKNA